MSERREVEIMIDEQIFEETCRELGYKVYRNVNIRGYSTQHLVGSVVVEAEGFGIGVVDGKLVYDDWRGIADKHLQKILPKYYEKLLSRKLRTNIETRHNSREFVFIVRR